MFRSPPTLATTWLPLTTAPLILVSPPESMPTVLPALMWLLVQLWSVPSLPPLPSAALAVIPAAKPFLP
ncbi:hypothetical protein WG78_15740 [Amantichitinum ursilacus]|uniref:Uncharacterized protein n=1 Tax=Amantichitinum ursilacus TaxID=857265 RepID=A0A0N1JS74_9NEIS|nr:hypothetical protein WG78_15740 [Amantichitinum ursilacus]